MPENLETPKILVVDVPEAMRESIFEIFRALLESAYGREPRRAGLLLLCARLGLGCAMPPAQPSASGRAPVAPARPAISAQPEPQGSPPAASSRVAPAPTDPLLAPGNEPNCGAPPENPHGYEWGVTEADGSCKACTRAPAALPRCTAPFQATDVTSVALEANLERKVRLRGVVNYAGALCTLRGGPCACNNRCSALLRLVHRDTPRPPLASKAERRRQRDEELAEPYDPRAENQPFPTSVVLTLSEKGSWSFASFADYATPDGALGCPGDENSICCPFALDRTSLTVRVIASGVLRATDESSEASEKEYRLALETLCRLPD